MNHTLLAHERTPASSQESSVPQQLPPISSALSSSTSSSSFFQPFKGPISSSLNEARQLAGPRPPRLTPIQASRLNGGIPALNFKALQLDDSSSDEEPEEKQPSENRKKKRIEDAPLLTFRSQKDGDAPEPDFLSLEPTAAVPPAAVPPAKVAPANFPPTKILKTSRSLLNHNSQKNGALFKKQKPKQEPKPHRIPATIQEILTSRPTLNLTQNNK